jgi:lysophospholipase L1-like esterase
MKRTAMKITVVLLLFSLTAIVLPGKQKPVIYLIGDSTVKNGGGRGENGQWGWGDFLHEHFDTTKISIKNYARGGRSSRTYQTEGLWDAVLSKIKPGDFVIMQFGHNDSSPVNDTLRARGTIKGTGEETEEIDNLITKKHEIVHTYGWYMRKFIKDTKAKGATAIVCSPVARNNFDESGKVKRTTDSYTKWASTVASEEQAYFIDLNDLVAIEYEKLGSDEVTKSLFLQDHTHTNKKGALINARLVAESLSKLDKKPFKKFLR